MKTKPISTGRSNLRGPLAKQLQCIKDVTWALGWAPQPPAWKGNVMQPGESSPWISDGHVLINLGFAQCKFSPAGERKFTAKVERLREPGKRWPGIAHQQAEKTVRKSAEGATAPGKITGVFLHRFHDGTRVIAVHIENTVSHEIIAVQGPKLRVVLDTVKPDSIKVSDEFSPVVLYRADKVAAVVMPFRAWSPVKTIPPFEELDDGEYPDFYEVLRKDKPVFVRFGELTYEEFTDIGERLKCDARFAMKRLEEMKAEALRRGIKLDLRDDTPATIH